LPNACYLSHLIPTRELRDFLERRPCRWQLSNFLIPTRELRVPSVRRNIVCEESELIPTRELRALSAACHVRAHLHTAGSDPNKGIESSRSILPRLLHILGSDPNKGIERQKTSQSVDKLVRCCLIPTRELRGWDADIPAKRCRLSSDPNKGIERRSAEHPTQPLSLADPNKGIESGISFQDLPQFL